MKNTGDNNTNINSDNQNGGITAQNVTIHNYHHESKQGIGKVNISFKSKIVKGAFIAIMLSGLGYVVKHSFFNNQITTKEEFYEFLVNYLQSSNDKNADVSDYFTKKVSIFYLYKDIDREKISEIRKKTDYIDTHLKVDLKNITLLRKENNINYWRFKGILICFRPSKRQYEKSNVEMEYGLDADNKIASIEQIRYWDDDYTDERPEE